MYKGSFFRIIFLWNHPHHVIDILPIRQILGERTPEMGWVLFLSESIRPLMNIQFKG